MKIDINLLKKLRNKTNISMDKCFNMLKITKNNYELSKKLLLEENIDNIISKENKFYKIFIYLEKNYSIILKCKFQTDLIFFLKETNYIVKKIIYSLLINKFKNILYLINKNSLNIKNLIKSLIIKTKENFKIKKYSIIKFNKNNLIYNYENKICLIINYINYKKNYLTKNSCLHIIFNKPCFVSIKSINLNFIKNKYKILKNKVNKYILKEKLINSLLKKYTFLNQYFIKNKNYKIKSILKSKRILIKKIIYYK